MNPSLKFEEINVV